MKVIMKITKNAFLSTFLFVLFLYSSITPAYALLPGFTSSCLDAKMGGADAAQMLIIDAPGKKPQGDKTTYIYMCSGGRNICGAPSTDGTDINKLLFGITARITDEETGKSYNPIQTQGSMKSGKNPTRTSADGLSFVDDPIIIAQYTKHGIYHRFYWVQPLVDDGGAVVPAPTLPDDQIITDDGVGSDGGLKIAQIPFVDTETPAPTSIPTTVKTGRNCANIKWDPRGYIFDAETLNPVKNITVTLFEKNKDGTYTQVMGGIGLINPYTTSAESGQFNFFVNPGLYKMEVNPANAVIADVAVINPTYQTLFTDQKGQSNIYKKGSDVEEVAGRVAVAHIPVQISDKSLIIDTLQLIVKDAIVNIDPQTNKSQMHITGTVSHPKSILTFTLTAIDEMGKTQILPPIITATSDLGEYDTYVDQVHMDKNNKPLYIQNINVKLELNPFYTAQSPTPKKSITYDVKTVPLYLEGIAYDEQGAPIPQAVVGIYPYFSLNPMYMVIADADGKFKIGSDHIPQLDYTLKYKKPSGEVVVVEPNTFIRQNALLFSQTKINPFTELNLSSTESKLIEKQVHETITQKDVQRMAYATKTQRDPSSNPNIQSKPTPKEAPTTLLLTITGIIVLIAISVFVGLKLLKKDAP